ncbi:MAG: hypothetical protein E7515_01100 [Ruminococcaceae bacterium]|nr:hypothetical protein [Oscillospiraceae bacterium]
MNNNKFNYRKALSGIRPSENLNERIIAMTEDKKTKKISVKRIIIAVAVVISILVIGSISVNAATDGKFFDSIEIYFNEKLMKGETKTYVDESGKKVEEYAVDLGGGNSFIVSNREDEEGTYSGMEFRSEVTTSSNDENN